MKQDVKNWFIPAMKPLKDWRSAVKPYPVWSMTGNLGVYPECGTSVYLWMTLNSWSQTVESIIRTARGQRCVIRKENVNA